MDRTTINLKRILLIDDQPICCIGLQRILRDRQEFGVQQITNSLAEMDRTQVPDVIAIDISVARNKGVSALKDLKNAFPKSTILVFTGHDEILFAERCLKAGAKGYLMKTATIDEILSAFDTVAHGNLHVSERMRVRMLNRLSGKHPLESENAIDRLSDRELLIVQHIGESKNNKEIANELQISIKTIESHRSRIKAKLRLSSANELVRYAMRLHNSAF